MNLKIIFLFLFISDCSFGVSILNNGNKFEDLFSEFDQSRWWKDFGTRHCGKTLTPGGCVWNKKENLRYVHHDSRTSRYWKSNELRISLKNDCEEKYCCPSPVECTSYTSGQISSKKAFGYGSFSFMIKINKDVTIPIATDDSGTEILDEQSAETNTDSANNNESNRQDDVGNLVKKFAGMHLGDSFFGDTTQEPPSFTTEEELEETTTELPCNYNDCAGPSSSSDNAGPSNIGESSYSRAGLGTEVTGFETQDEEDCSSCSGESGSTAEFRMRTMNSVNILFEEVDIILSICEGNLSNLKDIVRKLGTLYEDLLILEITVEKVLEQEAFRDFPERERLLNTIHGIQDMVQDALFRCQTSQNETGALPSNILTSVHMIYESLIHVEEMLISALDPRFDEEPLPEINLGYILDLQEEGEEVIDYNDTTTEDPSISSSSITDTNDFVSSDDKSFEESSEIVDVSTHTDSGETSNPSTLNYGALHCCVLQGSVEHKIFAKIGICLFNFPRKALIFAGIGKKTFKSVVKLPFDAAEKIGQYRIDWIPNRITWKVDNQFIGSLDKSHFPIPFGLLRMRFYIAPINSKRAPQDSMIEQTMQLFSVQYQSHVVKDELRFEIEHQDKRYIYLLIGSIITFAFGLIFRWRLKNQIPTGYTILAKREQMI